MAKTTHGKRLSRTPPPQPPPRVKLVVTSDVAFPVRVGAECGAVQERLPAPEGGEPVQTEGAETGKNLHSGLRFPPRGASVMLAHFTYLNRHEHLLSLMLWTDQHVFLLSLSLCGPFQQQCRKCPKQVASGSHE